MFRIWCVKWENKIYENLFSFFGVINDEYGVRAYTPLNGSLTGVDTRG